MATCLDDYQSMKDTMAQQFSEGNVSLEQSMTYQELLYRIGGVIHYPSDEYLTYLMTVDEMMFTDEIDCSDLFGGNSERERIMIFEIVQ